MRIVFVWIMGIFLITVIVFAWYVSQPLVYSFAKEANSTITNVSDDATAKTKTRQTMTIIMLFNNIWAPILVVLILIWMFLSSQRRDVESRWID